MLDPYLSILLNVKGVRRKKFKQYVISMFGFSFLNLSQQLISRTDAYFFQKISKENECNGKVLNR